jgi:hypothetical protein
VAHAAGHHVRGGSSRGSGAGAAAAAGVGLSFSVDGSCAEQLLPGQHPQQAAHAAHMAFCRYLASHALPIDVWDAGSQLLLGSCAVQLAGLLRQGRPQAELLLELPVLQQAAAGAAEGLQQQQQQPVVVGSLVLRVVNVAREASNPAARLLGFEAAAASASPALSPRKVSGQPAVGRVSAPVPARSAVEARACVRHCACTRACLRPSAAVCAPRAV